MATVWDSVVASASKAMTQAGEATQVAASKAKLHADLLLIDRDIQARKEKFGVDMYAHLENITSTQEFYVSDDRLINIIRPVLIKAQREVAAYERKRDAMKGKVNAAETNRVGSASIFGAETLGQKMLNAARFAQAGAREAAFKTELAMVERQILGFKEEFGTEMYPVFQSMEDNEGWLPTDRKVRSLYDSAREDIAAMEKSKQDKMKQIEALDKAGATGFAPPTAPPAAAIPSAPAIVATPVPPTNSYHTGNDQTPWASATPANDSSSASYGTAYGASQPTNGTYGATQPPSQTISFGGIHSGQQQQREIQNNDTSSFGFMQNQPNNMQSSMPQGGASGMTPSYSNSFQQPSQKQHQQYQSQQQSMNSASVFDPFDGIVSANNTNQANTNNAIGSSFGTTPATAAPAPSSGNAFDPFYGAGSQGSGSSSKLSEADMNLFKY